MPFNVPVIWGVSIPDINRNYAISFPAFHPGPVAHIGPGIAAHFKRNLQVMKFCFICLFYTTRTKVLLQFSMSVLGPATKTPFHCYL